MSESRRILQPRERRRHSWSTDFHPEPATSMSCSSAASSSVYRNINENYDKLTISVRRKLVPLKHSKKFASSVSAFSSSVVCRMYASVASTSCSLVGLSERRRIKDCLARSSLFRLTAFHGDSGANQTPMKSGRGQHHWRQNGNRHPRSPSRPATARRTPAERRIPQPQQRET